jgi:hypothetical protein
MAPIDQWLKSIGLSEYTNLFAANDIDVDILADLTAADLEELGISLGHRKKLLKAIAALGDQARPADDPAGKPRR